MSIQTLVDNIQRNRQVYNLFNPCPALPEEVASADAEFRRSFGVALPDAYQVLLLASNGITEDGLTIWPCKPYAMFRESVITANGHLQESLSEDYLYFGQRDDSVFVMERSTGRFMALELSGLSEWESFPNCAAMLETMLGAVVL